MEFTQGGRATERFNVLEPLFFNDEVVGVLDGDYVLGSVARGSVIRVRQEWRSSFKHPLVGLIVGVAAAGIPLQSVLGDPLGLWWLTSASPLRWLGSFFMACIGLYLLWGVATRKSEPWIVFVQGDGTPTAGNQSSIPSTGAERAFPLKRALSGEAVALLVTMFGDVVAGQNESDSRGSNDRP